MARILFISSQPFFQWRGSPIRVAFDVQALAELGHEVDLLTLPIGAERSIPGVRVIRVRNWFGIKQIAIGPSLGKAVFDVFLLFRALSMARRGAYDVVHCVEDTGPIGWLAAWRAGARMVFEKHSDPSSYRKGILRNIVMALYARVEEFAVHRADAVIGTGPGLVRQVERMHPGKAVHHIFDIPSSLVEASPESVAAARARYGVTEKTILATYVGSFASYQGLDLVFDAVPQVSKENGDVRFVVIGGTDEEIAVRREWLRARGVERAVLFPGKIPPDDLPAFLAASEMLLSPRISGVNTPLKLLDYLKAGRAIVATDTEANRLILNRDNALLVPASAQGIAYGVLQLARDAEQRTALGESGGRLIREQYNFREFKKRLDYCYLGLPS